MANLRTKDPRMVRAYTVKASAGKALADFCEENELSASRIVEGLIINFLKKNKI